MLTYTHTHTIESSSFFLCHPHHNYVSDFSIYSANEKKKEMGNNISPEDILVFSLLVKEKRKEREKFGCGQYT